MLPEELKEDYESILMPGEEDKEHWQIVKQRIKYVLISSIEELKAETGNLKRQKCNLQGLG